MFFYLKSCIILNRDCLYLENIRKLPHELQELCRSSSDISTEVSWEKSYYSTSRVFLGISIISKKNPLPLRGDNPERIPDGIPKEVIQRISGVLQVSLDKFLVKIWKKFCTIFFVGIPGEITVGILKVVPNENLEYNLHSMEKSLDKFTDDL